LPIEARRKLIEPDQPKISIARQCELLDLARSSFYYEAALETPLNLELLRRLDEQYTRTPFYGIRRMTVWLRSQHYEVNHKRVSRLLRLMGLEALYPKPHLSEPHPGHKIYPYLLRGLKIERVNQVWSTDITYIRLRQGFIYLTAIIDWYSRYVIAWQISNTLELDFCLETLERALVSGPPEIFNTDQGVQYTSTTFTSRLEAAGVRISMDGRGRALDNIFVERLWRSVNGKKCIFAIMLMCRRLLAV